MPTPTEYPPPTHTQQPTWPTAHTAHSQHCGHTALPAGQKRNPHRRADPAQTVYAQPLSEGPDPGLANKDYPSNLPRGFQRFGFEKLFRAVGFSDLGYGLVLLMVKSSAGVHPELIRNPALVQF